MVTQQQVPQGIHHVGHLALIAVRNVAQSRLAQHLQAGEAKILASGGDGLLLQVMMQWMLREAGHAWITIHSTQAAPWAAIGHVGVGTMFPGMARQA